MGLSKMVEHPIKMDDDWGYLYFRKPLSINLSSSNGNVNLTISQELDMIGPIVVWDFPLQGQSRKKAGGGRSIAVGVK